MINSSQRLLRKKTVILVYITWVQKVLGLFQFSLVVTYPVKSFIGGHSAHLPCGMLVELQHTHEATTIRLADTAVPG